MKRTIFVTVLGMTAALASYGDGYIFFSNYYSSSQQTGITYGNGPDTGLGVGNEISVELFYGASTATSTSQLTGIPSTVTQVGLNGVTSPAPLDNVYSYGDYYPGAGVFEDGPVLLPWSGAGVMTYAFAIYASGTLNGNFYEGWSPIADATIYPIPATPTSLPHNIIQVTWSVYSVPEPVTLTLGVVGLAMLNLFRRRRV